MAILSQRMQGGKGGKINNLSDNIILNFFLLMIPPASGVSIRLFSGQSPIILRWDEADVQSNTNGVVVIIIISILSEVQKNGFF